MYAHKEKVCWFKRHMKIKKIRTFSVGNFVSVKSPRIDSMSTDLHRVACIVVEVLGMEYHLYRLRYVLFVI